MPTGNGGATKPHRTPGPQLKFHNYLSLSMDSSHPLTFSCIHFHLSPVDQSDFSWALMPLSTTLLQGGHPGPWLYSIQPCGPTPVLKIPRKMLLLEEDLQTGRRDAYLQTYSLPFICLFNQLFLGSSGQEGCRKWAYSSRTLKVCQQGRV